MARVAFVAHCMLNQNAKVVGGALCRGINPLLLDQLRSHGWQVAQMPCPELTFTGLNRFWAVREQLDTRAYRRHCRRIVDAVAAAVCAHLDRGDEVVLIGLEGSPSMGVRVTSSDPERVGRPHWPEGAPELTSGSGILIEELLEELRARGVREPRAIGISHTLPGYDPDAERDELAAFLGG